MAKRFAVLWLSWIVLLVAAGRLVAMRDNWATGRLSLWPLVLIGVGVWLFDRRDERG